MATLRLSRLALIDKWPGVPNPNLSIPTDGWDNTTDNFTTTSAAQTPSYPVGTKIMAYTDNTNCPGYYTMMMLMFHDWSTNFDISADFSDGRFFCSHVGTGANPGCASTAQFADTSRAPYFIVANCVSTAVTDATKGTPIAIPCATLNSDGTGVYVATYGDAYGWFWVGGVCPCKDATLLQGTIGSLLGADITVDALMAPGPVFVDFTTSVPWLMGCDNSNAMDATTPAVLKGVNALSCGWVCVSAA